MKDKKKVVLGIYKTRGELEGAIDTLKAQGFRTSDISVLMNDPNTAQDLATQKGTKAPEGAATGAGVGVAVGGTLGLLAGLGALAIPGVGPLIAAGPIMGALAGAGVGGAVGGISGALIGLGFPEYEAKRYESRLKEGGLLLSVHVDDDQWQEKAETQLELTGAEDISSTTEVRESGDWNPLAGKQRDTEVPRHV